MGCQAVGPVTSLRHSRRRRETQICFPGGSKEGETGGSYGQRRDVLCGIVAIMVRGWSGMCVRLKGQGQCFLSFLGLHAREWLFITSSPPRLPEGRCILVVII